MTSRRTPRWVPKSAVLAMHERLISEHGGMPGLRSDALLDSALASPIDHFAYGKPDLFTLAARYASSLTRNHPFRDGNKRIALTVAGVFLELNAIRLEAPEPDAVSAILALVTKQMSEEEFAGWLRTQSVRVTKRKAVRAKGTSPPRRPRSRRKR